MRTLKITIMLVAIGPLALSACTTARTAGTIGGGEPSSYNTSVPTANGGAATDAQKSGSAEAPGQHGNVFVDSPEPGFNPDSIIEAP